MAPSVQISPDGGAWSTTLGTSVRSVNSFRRWDAALHARIGALPRSPADRWLRRLSDFANGGKLWLVVAALLGLRRGELRRAAIRGVGSLAVSSVFANMLLKRIFGRVRPDCAKLRCARQLRRLP